MKKIFASLLGLCLSTSVWANSKTCSAPETFIKQRDSVRYGQKSSREYNRIGLEREQLLVSGFSDLCWKEYVSIVRTLNLDSNTIALAVRAISVSFSKLPENLQDSVSNSLGQWVSQQQCPSFVKARILEDIPLVQGLGAASFYKPFVFSGDERVSNAATQALIQIVWSNIGKDRTSKEKSRDRSEVDSVNQAIYEVYSKRNGRALTSQQSKILAAIAAYGNAQ